jgi:hypothetical protein
MIDLKVRERPENFVNGFLSLRLPRERIRYTVLSDKDDEGAVGDRNRAEIQRLSYLALSARMMRIAAACSVISRNRPTFESPVGQRCEETVTPPLSPQGAAVAGRLGL